MMNTLQKMLVGFALAIGLLLVSSSVSQAQYASGYTYYPNPVRVYGEPYIYYHPIYQPVRSTYYYVPGYPQTVYYPTPYYNYRVSYPPVYYYPPIRGGRYFVGGVMVR
jgi:hypothetical protein